MKKWFAFILLLITFASTFYPCCVFDNCDEEEIAASKQTENPQPEGNCSPFFACHSCPGFTVVSNIVSIKKVTPQVQVHNEKPVDLNLSTYASSFWQPPRAC